MLSNSRMSMSGGGASQYINYESEAQRLQREADNFTKKYEHEKKRLMILEDQIKQTQEELREAQDRLKKVRPPTAQMKKDMNKIKILENNLEMHMLKYSKLQSGNRDLREQIDVMRKEHRNLLRANHSLVFDIMKQSDEAKKINVMTQSGQRVTDETNNQILALKSNHEDRKHRFESQIKGLQERLKEKEESGLETLAINKENNNMGNASLTRDKKSGATATESFSNPTAVLKLRLQRWTQNNREKKHLSDVYMRNVKVIEDSFAQITEATGIKNIQEIVTTFVKTEEQNYSLYNYVNMLNNEIDSIEEQNKVISDHIKRHEDLKKMSVKEKDQLKDKLRKQIADVKSQTQDKNTQIDQTMRDLTQVKECSRSMSHSFAQSDFQLVVAHPMIYDQDTQFKENNTTSYLAELEEYIAMLITYTAYAQELPDAAVSALSLEKMIPKRDLDNQGPLNIEAPSANDVSFPQTDDAETNEDDAQSVANGMCTNGKDLYKRFEDLIAKDHIRIGNNQSFTGVQNTSNNKRRNEH